MQINLRGFSKNVVLFGAIPILLFGWVTVKAQTQVQGTLWGSATITSDQRYRGLSQSVNQPAIKTDIKYGFPVGFYVGTEWRSVSERIYAGANSELDLYGGFKGDFSLFAIDVGTNYQSFSKSNGSYLGLDNKQTKIRLHDFYLSLTWSLLNVRIDYALSDHFSLANTSGSYYVQVNAEPEVANNVRLIFHSGYQKLRHQGDGSYSDYSAGVIIQINKTYALSVVGTGSNAEDQVYRVNKNDNDQVNIGKSALVVSLISRF